MANDSNVDERRRLTFINLANGVTLETLMASTQQSELEVKEDFEFVARKIISYRFERAMPYVPCRTIGEARASRHEFLRVLDKLNLGTKPKFRSVEAMPMEDAMPRLAMMGGRK